MSYPLEHITEQDRQGRRLAVQYEVGRILSESGDLEAAAPRILHTIGEGLSWDYAGLWTVDNREDVLRCVETWHAPWGTYPEFEAVSLGVTFAAGVGLPGRVWASGEPDWIGDVTRDANFARIKVAGSEGLHAAAAFPILLGGRVLGVFEFLGGKVRAPDPQTLELMAQLGGQIGQFLERERSREAVEESEARKAAMLESALDAIVTMDHRGRVVEWNPAAERTFGYSREAAVGREMAELIIPPSLRARHRQGLATYLDTGEGAVLGRRIEITAMRSDCSEFPVELAITRVPIGGPPLFTGYIRDISERKRTEQALAQSEGRFRAIFEGAAIGIRLSTLEGRTLESNPAWQQMLGYSAEELQGMHFNQYTHPSDVAPDTELFGELVAGKRDYYDLEKCYIRKDGQRIWGRLTVSLIRDATGKPRFTVGMIEDITERKRAEEELKQSEESLAEAQRIAHLGSWEWDLGTGEVRWSDEAYRIYGYAPQQIAPTEQTFWDLVHPEDRQHVERAIHDTLHEGQPYELEHRVLRPDGTERVVHRQGEVILDDAGRPVRLVGTVLDVTERKAAEERVERALQLRNRFLSVASHELRTPVTMIRGYAQLLQRRAKQRGDAELLRPLEVLNRQVDRMTALIDDLLEVSRIEGGRLEFEEAPFNLDTAVQEVVDEMAMAAPDFSLRVAEQVKDLWVRGDRMRIQRVVTNLLSNAVKYSGKRKEIDIAVGREGDQVVVAVTDYGIGIPQEQQSQVFDLYFRASNVSTEHYGGLGLGMYISKTIIERHGGEMWVVSEESRGSTFHFSLPTLERGEELA